MPHIVRSLPAVSCVPGGASAEPSLAPPSEASVPLPPSVEPQVTAQVLPHTTYPALQVKPHCPVVHVAAPLVGAGQGTQAVPQESGDVSSEQALSHAWYPPPQMKPHLPAA